MILLTTTSDLFRLVTGTATTLDVHCTWADKVTATGVVTPGRTNTLISTATTTTVVAAAASGSVRTIKGMHARNRGTVTTLVTVLHSDGTNIPELTTAVLNPGQALVYTEQVGFWVNEGPLGGSGSVATSVVDWSVGQARIVRLAADYSNANATANTPLNIHELTFPILAGQTYFLRASGWYTAAATTTGSRFMFDTTATPTLLVTRTEGTLTATTKTSIEGTTAIDIPSAASATSLTAANSFFVEGFVTPWVDDRVTLRFASEISASAVVVKTGSLFLAQRTL